eukprot:TRINITY_DN12898_c0_g1_i1.p1 TRINITY_DN12898_c0_g1~~TRINITY_DN12898_c0_g1_i1.p1  ORF type:complete len:337 (+),score=80.13 TRINITY_DN12898_c0_g1_i1:70-1080(+)
MKNVELSSIPSLRPQVFSMDQVEEIKEHLGREGYVAVKVMEREEAEERYQELWGFVENLESGIDRSDPSTWKPKSWPHQMYGIIKSYAIGQSKVLWNCRKNENIRKLFSILWDTSIDNLLTSYDGACLYPSCEGEDCFFNKTSMRGWPHRDQNPEKQDVLCFQGQLNLKDNLGESDGGFMVWPKTQEIDWTESDEKAKGIKGDWYKIPEKLIQNEPNCTIRTVAGTFIIWDSRTVHANRPPAPSGECRAVAYVSMLPKSKCPLSQIAKREKYFRTGRTTSHWAYPVTVNADTIFRSHSEVDPKKIISNFALKEELLSDPVVRSLVGIGKCKRKLFP